MLPFQICSDGHELMRGESARTANGIILGWITYHSLQPKLLVPGSWPPWKTYEQDTRNEMRARRPKVNYIQSSPTPQFIPDIQLPRPASDPLPPSITHLQILSYNFHTLFIFPITSSPPNPSPPRLSKSTLLSRCSRLAKTGSPHRPREKPRTSLPASTSGSV